MRKRRSGMNTTEEAENKGDLPLIVFFCQRVGYSPSSSPGHFKGFIM